MQQQIGSTMLAGYVPLANPVIEGQGRRTAQVATQILFPLSATSAFGVSLKVWEQKVRGGVKGIIIGVSNFVKDLLNGSLPHQFKKC